MSAFAPLYIHRYIQYGALVLRSQLGPQCAAPSVPIGDGVLCLAFQVEADMTMQSALAFWRKRVGDSVEDGNGDGDGVGGGEGDAAAGLPVEVVGVVVEVEAEEELVEDVNPEEVEEEVKEEEKEVVAVAVGLAAAVPFDVEEAVGEVASMERFWLQMRELDLQFESLAGVDGAPVALCALAVNDLEARDAQAVAVMKSNADNVHVVPDAQEVAAQEVTVPVAPDAQAVANAVTVLVAPVAQAVAVAVQEEIEIEHSNDLVAPDAQAVAVAVAVQEEIEIEHSNDLVAPDAQAGAVAVNVLVAPDAQAIMGQDDKEGDAAKSDVVPIAPDAKDDQWHAEDQDWYEEYVVEQWVIELASNAVKEEFGLVFCGYEYAEVIAVCEDIAFEAVSDLDYEEVLWDEWKFIKKMKAALHARNSVLLKLFLEVKQHDSEAVDAMAANSADAGVQTKLRGGERNHKNDTHKS